MTKAAKKKGKKPYVPPANPREALSRLNKQIRIMTSAKSVGADAQKIAKTEANKLVKYLEGFVDMTETLVNERDNRDRERADSTMHTHSEDKDKEATTKTEEVEHRNLGDGND